MDCVNHVWLSIIAGGAVRRLHQFSGSRVSRIIAKEPQSPLKRIFRTECCQEGVSTADLCRQIDQLACSPIESVGGGKNINIVGYIFF